MTKLPDDVPDCMVFLLAKAYQKAHAGFKQQLKPYDLTNLQHLVLEALWYRQGMTAARMGKFLILDKATLSGVIDRMVKAEWIEKKPNPDDRRRQLLYTTPKADALKGELVKERQKANEEILKGFSLEERLLFKRLLVDVINPAE